MVNLKTHQNISRIFLWTIPVLTAVLGFTVNNVNYKIYLPIWIIGASLMLWASWILGARHIRNLDADKRYLATSGFLLMSPWIFYLIFAGMGSPPGTYAEWVSKAFEQQVRYSFLIAGLLNRAGKVR